MWLCQCECGNTALVRSSHLIKGLVKSCGCLKLEGIETRLQAGTNGAVKRTHGLSRRVEHTIWNAIQQRCYNPNTNNYANYGGRGIRVCTRWLGEYGFQSFWNDMGPRPTKHHSIERLNTAGDYTPDNCVWALAKQQMRNTRRNRCITYQGQTRTLAEWAEVLKLNYKNLHHRLTRGWPVKRAFSQKQRKSTRKELQDD